ncbi:reverse transcriptase domain-containing protein [Tanacetum coccineum]
MLTTTTMFAATTLENTHLAYRASTSINPNHVISPAFVDANYETLESLLRVRRRQMRNNDLRTELEYFSDDYDEEREMEPRPEPAKTVTPLLRAASPRVRRRRERVVGFEETQNRGESRVERSSEGGRPSEEASRGNGSQNPMYTFPNMPAYANPNSTGLFPNPLGSVTPFVCWIEDYPLLDRLKIPSHIGSYEGKGDPDNFLHLFEGAIRMQKWLMPIACHMFTYTLKDSARIWWNSQKAGSILDYEDLKAKFRSQFSQQKKFTKTHLAAHNIKQRENESIRAFITRYTDDTFHKLLSNLVKSPREILAIERIAKTFELLLQLPRPNWSKDKTRYCHFHKDYGHETNKYQELKHQIEEAIKTGQLTHLVKGVTKKREKTSETQSGEKKKEEKPELEKTSILIVSGRDHRLKKRPASDNGTGEITFPPITN